MQSLSLCRRINFWILAKLGHCGSVFITQDNDNGVEGFKMGLGGGMLEVTTLMDFSERFRSQKISYFDLNLGYLCLVLKSILKRRL